MISRSRHKKCDETRPACNKCSSTGQKCDGYTNIPLNKNSTNTVISRRELVVQLAPLADPSIVDLRADESRVFDYFMAVASFNSASYFYDDFWYRSIRQMSTSQISPAVKHAAIATAVTHLQHSFRASGLTDRSKEMDYFALRQISKAITYLLERPVPKDLVEKCTYRKLVLSACLLLSGVGMSRNDRPASRERPI